MTESKTMQRSDILLFSLFALMLLLALVAFHPGYFFPDTLKWMCIALMAMVLLSSYAINLIKALLKQDAIVVLDGLDVGLLTFIAYATLSLSWSPDPRGAVISLLYCIIMGVVFLSIRHVTLFKQSAVQVAMFVIITLASTIVLCLQYAQPARWGGFFNENFLTEFLLLSLPFTAGLAGYVYTRQSPFRQNIEKGLTLKKALSLLPILLPISLLVWVLGYLVLQNPSKLEFFVIPATLMLFVLARLWQLSRIKALLLALGLLIVVSVLLAVAWQGGNSYRDSILPRLALYFDTLLLFWQSPLIGHGLGAFQALFPSVQEKHIEYIEYFPSLIFSIGKFGVAKSAHNDYLEFLCDFGLVGLLILAWPVFIFVRGLAMQAHVSEFIGISKKISLLALVMVLLNALLEFPLQNPATALLAVIAIALPAQTISTPVILRLQHPGLITSIALLSILLSGCLSVAIWRADQAQQAFFKMSQYYYDDPQKAFDFNEQALQSNPFDFRLRMQLYESLVHWNRAVGSPPVNSEAYDAVYAQARTVGRQYLMLLRRLEYLLDTQRYQTRQAEVTETLDWLRTHFARHPDVWIADAYYHVLSGRTQAASMSLAQASALEMDAEQQQRVMILQNLVQQPR